MLPKPIHNKGTTFIENTKTSHFIFFLQTKKPEDKIKFSVWRNIYNRKIKQAKKVYFSKLIGYQNEIPRRCGKHEKHYMVGKKPNQSSMKLIP